MHMYVCTSDDFLACYYVGKSIRMFLKKLNQRKNSDAWVIFIFLPLKPMMGIDYTWSKVVQSYSLYKQILRRGKICLLE